jgi:hypothetical protein
MIKVIKIPVGSQPFVTEIEPTLAAMQAEVGGYIELVPMGRTGLDLCVNEEGKMIGLPVNFPIFGGQDLVCGDALLVRHDSLGEAVSVTKKDIDDIVGGWRGRL